MKQFVFVAVNFNNSKVTIEYMNSINSLQLEEEDFINIIIVDNKSNNEELTKLQSFCNQQNNVELIKENVNLGYFKGLNKGINYFQNKENKIFIVGNNDLVFEKQFLINLNNISYTDDVLVIAPNIITKEGRYQNPHVIKKVPTIEKVKARIYFSNYYIAQFGRIIFLLLRKFKKVNVKKVNNYPQMKIKRGIGACYVLTPSFFLNFDGLDDRVFMWGEEALLSNQVESVNGSILYAPSIKIIHNESSSVKNIQPKEKYYIVKTSYKIYRKFL